MHPLGMLWKWVSLTPSFVFLSASRTSWGKQHYVAMPFILMIFFTLLHKQWEQLSMDWLLKSSAKTNVFSSKLFPCDIFPVMKRWLCITPYSHIVLRMMPCSMYVCMNRCIDVYIHTYVEIKGLDWLSSFINLYVFVRW